MVSVVGVPHRSDSVFEQKMENELSMLRIVLDSSMGSGNVEGGSVGRVICLLNSVHLFSSSTHLFVSFRVTLDRYSLPTHLFWTQPKATKNPSTTDSANSRFFSSSFLAISQFHYDPHVDLQVDLHLIFDADENQGPGVICTQCNEKPVWDDER